MLDGVRKSPMKESDGDTFAEVIYESCNRLPKSSQSLPSKLSSSGAGPHRGTKSRLFLLTSKSQFLFLTKFLVLLVPSSYERLLDDMLFYSGISIQLRTPKNIGTNKIYESIA